jgi:carbonic anhydrase/acetyltransferase-like protein (isoleucine patch superfamily)
VLSALTRAALVARSIGDRSVVQSSPVNPTGFSARTHVGDWVTIGKGCVLRGCTVENYCLVGDGSILQEGSLMEVNSILEPGSVLPAGARVPEGQVYGGNPAQFVRKLEKEEIAQIESVGDDMAVLAAKHADEFLPCAAARPRPSRRSSVAPRALLLRCLRSPSMTRVLLPRYGTNYQLREKM